MSSNRDDLELVIGLECHVQLATASKLFCACPSGAFGAEPNSAVCPVCTGQPGALPVLNRGAVERAFLAALALGARIRERSVFARKNYFYPDLPKGYQISQYEEPFSEGGTVEIGSEGRKVRLHRVHMEEDAGKLLHALGSEALPYSLVDLNRAGTPLIEIVTEPDLRSSQEAFDYLNELKAALQYVGVSNCDMEKGELRCDANVSLRPRGTTVLGTKAEVKNLNSFRAVRDAIDHEAARQAEVLRAGGRVAQETRLWDELARETRPMRSKEEAHDYRYFPEPDLVPLVADPAWLEELRGRLPEAPRARRARFESGLGLSAYDAGVLTSSRAMADYVEAVIAAGVKPKLAASWVAVELAGRLNAVGVDVSKSPVDAARLTGLLKLVEGGGISGQAGKKVLDEMFKSPKPADALVVELGLAQVSDDGQLRDWAREAVAGNPKAAEDFKNGSAKAIGALVGAVMKKSKGKANPGKVNEILLELLK